MIQRLTLLLFCLSCWIGIAVPADEFPQRLVGLLEPGMHIGFGTSTTASDQHIEVLVWTKERFEMEVDARKMPIAELSDKYSVVAEGVKKLDSIQDARTAALGLTVQWAPLYSPTTVLHVGDDYVLFQSAESPQIRLAIPSDRIAAIRWGMNHPTLNRAPRSPKR